VFAKPTKSSLMNPKDVVSRLREKYSKQHARMLYINSDEFYEKSQKVKSNYYSNNDTNSLSPKPSPKPVIQGEIKSRINELRMENTASVKIERKSIVIIERPSNNGFRLLNKRKMSKSPLSQEIKK